MDIKEEIKKVEEEFNNLDAQKKMYQERIIACENRQHELNGRYNLLKEMEAEGAVAVEEVPVDESKAETPVEVAEEKKE